MHLTHFVVVDGVVRAFSPAPCACCGQLGTRWIVDLTPASFEIHIDAGSYRLELLGLERLEHLPPLLGLDALQRLACEGCRESQQRAGAA